MDTELPQLDFEGAIDDMRGSPNGPKKIKVKKTGETHNERSRSSTRRTVHRQEDITFHFNTTIHTLH
jgi:hypothetical protein